MIGMPDDTWGETGHAFVETTPGGDLSENDVILMCQGLLAKYKWPKKVTFVDTFPRTSLGKIRKGELD